MTTHDAPTTATIHEPIRLFDGAAPGSEGWTHQEMAYFANFFDTDVVTNVVVPTLTPVLPAVGNGTGVIVAPGGGYHALSINREGFEVAQWLADRGVAAFVLKYRTVPSGDDAVAELIEKMTKGVAELEMADAATLALLDAEAAVRLVRARADDFAIEADRVGFIGFSAGGNLTLRVAFSEHAEARPNFVAPIYAAAHDLDVSAPPEGSGPMFLAAATNDQLGLADHSIDIYRQWHAAGLPAELHMYAEGGHGFGMGVQGLPSDTWIERYGDWLVSTGLMAG